MIIGPLIYGLILFVLLPWGLFMILKNFKATPNLKSMVKTCLITILGYILLVILTILSVLSGFILIVGPIALISMPFFIWKDFWVYWENRMVARQVQEIPAFKFEIFDLYQAIIGLLALLYTSHLLLPMSETASLTVFVWCFFSVVCGFIVCHDTMRFLGSPKNALERLNRSLGYFFFMYLFLPFALLSWLIWKFNLYYSIKIAFEEAQARTYRS